MNPSQIRDQFRSYFIKTILAITTLYITFGVAGYLSYGQSQKKITDDIIWNIFWTFWMIAGPETNEIITLNLPSDGGFNFAILVKICLCFRCPFSSSSTSLRNSTICETQENIKFNFQPLLHLSHHALPCYFHLGKEVGGKNGEIQNTICIIHKYNLYTCRLPKDQPQPSSCVSSLFFSPALLYWRCQYFSITIITEIVINITIVILTSLFVLKVPVLPSSPQ